MIHQSGKIKDTAEREKFLKWLENLEFEIFNIPKPDIILFLYLDPAVAQKLALQEHKHGGQQDIHEQDLDHMKDSIEAAEYVAKKYNWLKINCLGGDGNIASREDIQKKVVEILEKHI